MTTPALVFVDADGHLLEPPTALVDYAPAAYRDTIWQVRPDADGVEWLTLEDMRMEAAVMALAGAGGFTDEQRVKAHSGSLAYADLPPTCWDGAARLDTLDGDNIAHSVLYPTMLLTFQSLRSIEFAEVQCQVYNNWLSDLCAIGRGRLHGVAILPHLDPERGRRDPPCRDAAPHRRRTGSPKPGDGVASAQPRDLRPDLASGVRGRTPDRHAPPVVWGSPRRRARTAARPAGHL